MDVLPDVDFCPVGNWKDSDTFSGVLFGIEQIPELGTLLFRIPAMCLTPEGKNALFGAGFFLVSTRASKHDIKLVLI